MLTVVWLLLLVQIIWSLDRFRASIGCWQCVRNPVMAAGSAEVVGVGGGVRSQPRLDAWPECAPGTPQSHHHAWALPLASAAKRDIPAIVRGV